MLGLVRWHPDAANGPIQRWMEWSGTQFDYGSVDASGQAGWSRFYSSNVSFKRRLFESVGGFDPDFPFLYEDIELGWRMSEAGMRLWFEPGALTRHDHRYDWLALRRRFETAARAERLMTRKHPWFEPWFHERAREALDTAPPSPVWPRLVDRLPAGRWRNRARSEANRWYLRQLAPFFMNAWDSDRDLDELKTYLGDGFDPDRYHRHTHVIEDELAAAPDEETFYRTSEAYLYDLTAFGSWDVKIPYRADIRRYSSPGSRLLDYGCGIGTDGLRLAGLGYRVDFADYDNPSTRYLRWRMAERNMTDSTVYDIEADQIPNHYHLAFALDVIEHVADPFAFLARLESAADLVAVNFLDPDPHDTHLHHDLPVPDLLDHAESRGLLRYRLYHGRSHFVIYRSASADRDEPAGRPPAWRSALERRVGPVLSRRLPGRAPAAPGGQCWGVQGSERGPGRPSR